MEPKATVVDLRPSARDTWIPGGVLALATGSFAIGVTEFVIMGLLLEVSADLGVSLSSAGLLISGYALGVVAGAPIVTTATTRLPRKRVLVGLMAIFVVGNAACAAAPTYSALMAARVLTALAHGTFFGVGSVVATGLVAEQRRASAIAVMFTGLTVANILGVPLGTWLGHHFGWRATFWAVALVGVAALGIVTALVPEARHESAHADWRSDLQIIARPQVLLGLATTVLGYAGVFAVFTYIAPALTMISGFPQTAVPPILLVFGVGLVAGNFIGGRLADRHLEGTVLGTLAGLGLVLASMTAGLHDRTGAVVAVGLLGAAGFATVAPLQMWVLSKADGVGQTLASSFNIAAFNLGNAIGAWAGGAVIVHGPGLSLLPLMSSLFPLAAIAVALASIRASRVAARDFREPRDAVVQPINFSKG